MEGSETSIVSIRRRMRAVTREDFVAQDERSILTTTPTTLAAWAHAHLRPALLGAAR